MPASQPYPNRPFKIPQRMKNRLLQQLLLLHTNTLPHIPKHNPTHLLHQSRIPQMQQHPVPLIRLRPNILQKQNRLGLNPRSIRRPQPLHKDRNTPAIQPPPGHTRPKHPQSLRTANLPQPLAVKTMPPTRRIHPILTREIRRHHRPIKRNQIRLIVQPDMQRSVIAIPNKRLRIRANQPGIQMRKQLRRTPPSPRTDNPVDRRISKRRMKIPHPLLNRPRIIERPAIQRMRSHNRPIPQRFKMNHPTPHQLSLRRTSRRDHRQRSASAQTTRLRRSHHDRHSAQTSPRQIISAGPVNIIALSLPSQTVRCAPPSATAVNSLSVPRIVIAAAEEAQVPVPEEVVGPQPRS